MAKQERINKPVDQEEATKMSEEDAVRQAKNVGKTALSDEYNKELDDLLDAIDDLINEETVEMAQNYLQKGGE